jgi:hypothetical protein
MAETLARILEREEELADFEMFHFAGHWLANPGDLAAAARRVTGDATIPIRPFPYPVIIALSPFVTMFRELLEMRYLWRRPIGLDGRKLRAFLGDVPTTPLDAAVRESLADLDVTPIEESAKPASCKPWTSDRAKPYIASHVRAHAV